MVLFTLFSTRNHLFATGAILTIQISSFLIKMPSSLSSTTTLAGLSRPYLLATSIGIMIVELIFPLRKVCVTFFILVNLFLDLRDLGRYIKYDTYVVFVTMEKNETLTAFIKYKRDQATKNRQEVLNALIDLSLEGALKVDNIRKIGVVRECSPRSRGTQETQEDRKWVSVMQVLDYLETKSTKEIEEGILEIKRRYESGDINDKTRDRLIEKEKKRHRYIRRTVERALVYLKEHGSVIHRNHKYSLSNAAILDTTFSSSYVGFTALSNLMENLHNPTGRTLKENIEQLITFFGCYAFFCLLEAGRPIDDNFVNMVRHFPISKGEKDRLTESWMLDVLQPLVMYKFFLQTFLNQMDDQKVRGIKRRGGYHLDHTSLKAVPIAITPAVLYHNSSPPLGDKRLLYRLDEKMYKKITEIFKKMYPEIYWQLIKGSVSNDPRGAKNNYARWMSDIPKLSEDD